MLYFDHNATTFLAPEVAETMGAALREVYGNPSSTHREGQIARHHLENSRRIIAEFLAASPAELVFTSGGTESNNLAILGLVPNLPQGTKHIVATAIEHPAVLEPCRQLERAGASVSIVAPDAVIGAIRSDTCLVSVMHANNEVGWLQPLREIATAVQKRRAAGQQIFLHSDGVQAVGKIDVNLRELGVDLYSLSAHKIFGPKGIGALFVRKGTPLHGIQYGGRHERERRAGTENVPAAMAFARAVELCQHSAAVNLAALRDSFEAQLLATLPEIEVNGVTERRLPNTSNILFHGISAEALVISLDMKGIGVSTGAACSSGSIEPSHVLLALGLTTGQAKASVRFSFGRYNTAAEITTLVNAVKTAVTKLRIAAKVEKRFAS